MKPTHQKTKKKKKELKLAHFTERLKKKNCCSDAESSHVSSSGEENQQINVIEANLVDEFYQSVEPHVIHSENKLLYFDHLCVASQFPPLLNLKLFPNGKEVSESLSAYYSVRDYLEFKNDLNIISNRNVQCYVIADGNVPRTAAVFACATNWRVFSIDPRMKQKWVCKFNNDVVSMDNEQGQPKEQDFVEGLESTPSIQRLYPFSMTSTEFLQTSIFKKVKSLKSDLNIIVAVHSHADLWEFYNEIPSPKLCLEIPCCFKPNIQREPITVFTDEALHSEKNTIYMWYEE